MKFKSFLITGTDTSVGKTAVASGIAAALSRRFAVGVFKPSETGCAVDQAGRLLPADAARLKFFSNCRLDLQTICPYPLRQPLAPLVAAQLEGLTIDLAALAQAHDAIAAAHDVTLIEGAGGLLVPLAPAVTFAALATRLQVPVVVVVASRLGAINHALLTVRYAQQVGVRVLGYVMNFLTADPDLAARTNVEVLTDWLGPPLGIVPYLGEVSMTPAERERLADLFTSVLPIDALLEKAQS